MGTPKEKEMITLRKTQLRTKPPGISILHQQIAMKIMFYITFPVMRMVLLLCLRKIDINFAQS